MASRALAFSDPEVKGLLASAFVPIAENCSHLQRQQDPEGDFFRFVAEQGHYGGRTVPSDTRQGEYACTPDGRLLGSINTRQAAPLLGMLRQALERWEALDAAGRSAGPVDPAPAADARYARTAPPGGLVLRVFARDILPRDSERRAAEDWRTQAVNHDHAWFRAEEARDLVPADLAPGSRRDVPGPLARRIARFHLLDNVRGETPMWRRGDVRRCGLTSLVETVDGDGRAHLRLDGTFRSETAGSWAVRPFGERLAQTERGFDGTLLGHATWDPAAGRFTAFEAVALGTRWGGSEHNCRWDDLEPAPLGVLFELADGRAPGDGTPPQGSLSDYWNP